ncbi:MAG: DUF309 domain-containing protein [Heliomarina sp.]|uniref:DUF309 domain-containing protein n=1 Tax=Heliomarina sp. TaxID=2917556 RepID=UPI0040582F6F
MKRPEDIPFPPHAYVPGRNERHDESLFEAFHASVQPGMSPEELEQTLAWRAGWLFVRHGYFWEAHEVLEPVWMTLEDGPERQFVQGVIQTANAALKLEMDRPNAVRRLCDIADGHLDACGEVGAIMGVPLSEVRRFIKETRGKANLSDGKCAL